MTDLSLTLDIKYDIKRDRFEVGGDVKEEKRVDLVGMFLRSQLGQGLDRNEAEERDVYHITITWHPKDDSISVRSDTGNKGLRDGILWKFCGMYAA